MTASSASIASEAAHRYARALFQHGDDEGILATIATDLNTVERLARESSDLTRLLDSPAFARGDKVTALSAIANKAELNKATINFLAIMAKNGRASDILGACQAFGKLYARHRGIKHTALTTAKEMSADQRKRLEGVLTKTVGNNIELETKVDPALVGGIQLRIGSTLIDASIASKLDRMNTAMKGA